jgi:Na+-driven multidrug efflux pump
MRSTELSAQIRLAIPLAAQQLGFQLMGTVDAALLGRYDDSALAAAGVGNSVLLPPPASATACCSRSSRSASAS